MRSPYICYHLNIIIYRRVLVVSVTKFSDTIFSATRWYASAAHPNVTSLSSSLSDWLLDVGSLTQRLQRQSDFNVQVLRHTSGVLTPDELANLSPWDTRSTQCREVLLRDGVTPLVFARSVIPCAESGLLHELQHIGGRPLGDMLFTHPNVRRGHFQLAQFAPDSPVGQLNQQLTGVQAEVWGRRRNFYVDDVPVLVAEVFLSTAPCYN